MKSYGVADYFDKYIPGVTVPKDLLVSLKSVKKSGLPKPEKKQKYKEVNNEFFVPFIKVKGTVFRGLPGGQKPRFPSRHKSRE